MKRPASATAALAVAAAGGAWAESVAAPAARPKFEVVSIKPCKGEPAPMPGRKGARGGNIGATPGRLIAECATLGTLIRSAHIQFADGQRHPFLSPRILLQHINGSPPWMDSDRFTIEAKADGPATVEMLRGPLLGALLEDRFKLSIHTETRQIPVYELRVARSGPKLQPAKPGSCVTLERGQPPPAGRPICGGFSGDHMYGTTMANFCHQLTAILDRDVIDKTGITGTYDIRFEWPPEAVLPGAEARAIENDPDLRNAMFASRLKGAIPRLGLRLEPATGPGEFLVIDHVEKPAVN